jgi:hypothetical protein
MEFCERGDLWNEIRRHRKCGTRFEEKHVWDIAFQLLLALHDCHSRPEKILHRDIKPANIFIDRNGTVKLGDFGLARVLGKESFFAHTNVGTPFYMSPEQINEKPCVHHACSPLPRLRYCNSLRRYNEKSDMWSLGCLLYEMCSLHPPFEASNQLALAMKIKTGRFDRVPSCFSEELQRFIRALIEVDQTRRMGVEAALEAREMAARMRERRMESKAKREGEVEAVRAVMAPPVTMVAAGSDAAVVAAAPAAAAGGGAAKPIQFQRPVTADASHQPPPPLPPHAAALRLEPTAPAPPPLPLAQCKSCGDASGRLEALQVPPLSHARIVCQRRP